MGSLGHESRVLITPTSFTELWGNPEAKNRFYRMKIWTTFLDSWQKACKDCSEARPQQMPGTMVKPWSNPGQTLVKP
jgi:hypothetical protein